MQIQGHPSIPYGLGSIVYEKRNTFNHYVARRYRGKNANGDTQYIHIGSFPTWEDAYAALLDVRFSSREELISGSMTTSELCAFALRTLKRTSASDSIISKFQTSMRKCSRIADLPYQTITGNEMNKLVFECESYQTRCSMRRFFRLLDEEAVRRGVPCKMYSGFISTIRQTESDIQISRNPMEHWEIRNILAHREDKDMYIPLILLFTGMRPVEMRSLTDRNIEHGSEPGQLCIKGGAKTISGRDRIIPVHPVILDFVLKAVKEHPCGYLFPNSSGRRMSQAEFTLRFKMAVATLARAGHTPYDCRHTFCSELDNQNIPYNIINFLMGHRQYNEGDDRYKHLHLKREKLWSAILSLYQRAGSDTRQESGK